MGATVYNLREAYTQEVARALAISIDFEILWGLGDGGLSDIARDIKEVTGSKLRLTDARSWHGKWYKQNYDYFRQQVFNKHFNPKLEDI